MCLVGVICCRMRVVWVAEFGFGTGFGFCTHLNSGPFLSIAPPGTCDRMPVRSPGFLLLLPLPLDSLSSWGAAGTDGRMGEVSELGGAIL